MNEKIKILLEKFQSVYDNKNIDELDQFMSDFFQGKENIAIMGTSDGELCLDYERCRKLFSDDFEYWTFEKLNINEAVVKETENLIIVTVPAYFTFTFRDDNEENRNGHYQDILDMLSEESKDSRPLKVKFSEINFELDHIYHVRENKPRKYRYDLRVTFIINQDYKVLQINYSVPDNIKRPDARIYLNSPFSNYYDFDLKKLKEKKNLSVMDQEVRTFLRKGFRNYFDKENLSERFVNNLLLVSVDNKMASNYNELKDLIEFQNQYWDRITINEEVAYVDIMDNQAIVMARGIATSKRSEAQYFEDTRKEILSLKENDSLTTKEKMFKIRQLISFAFKETTIGSKYENPLRLHIVLTKENKQWKINYLQMSYSFFYILEDKNEFMKQID